MVRDRLGPLVRLSLVRRVIDFVVDLRIDSSAMTEIAVVTAKHVAVK